MTYDIIAIHKKPFTWSSLIHSHVFILLVLLFLMAFPSLPLQAASLTYDKATGQLVGFDIERNDNPSTINSYKVSGEFYTNPGYIGRLLYVGEPTTFTFSNIGTIPPGSSNRFYFTQTDGNGHSREFFLVLRAKGLFHGGTTQSDFSGKNSEIQGNTGTYVLSEGAGPELVSIWEYGYNTSGKYGRYNGINSYKYRYKYSYIWIDAIIIHTSYKTWGNNDDTRYGNYASNLQISTSNGQNLMLNLHGAILDTQGGQITPFFHFFEIEKKYTCSIPFNDIKYLNNAGTALEIATIKFYSDHKKAKITISSDSGGIHTDFSFKAAGTTTGPSFPHKLAFQSTLPAANVVEITSNLRSFVSLEQTHTSPLGDSTSSHILEGKIKLFVPQGTTPPVSGAYRSTIYVLVEPTT